VNYDPGPPNAIPEHFWSVAPSDANGTFLSPIAGEQGNNSDLGFGTYETPIDLTLHAGQFYIVSFQANDNPNYIALDRGPNLPFVTTDGNFQVVGGDFPGFGIVTSVLAQFSLDAPVPEPATSTLLFSAFLVIGGMRLLRWPRTIRCSILVALLCRTAIASSATQLMAQVIPPNLPPAANISWFL
jgi:hypothetical protein